MSGIKMFLQLMTSECKGVLGVLDIWYCLFFIIYMYIYKWVKIEEIHQ